MPRDYDDYYDWDEDPGYENENPFGFSMFPMRMQPDMDDPMDPPRPGGPGRRPGGPGRPGGPMGPGNNEMPPGPPPRNEPMRTTKGSVGGPSLYRVDAGAIRNCRYRFTYLWLENGRSFWAWLTFVGRSSVAGYRWTGYRWVYFGTDLDNISDFECY